jgi:serine/threonine protein kinase
VYLCKQVFLNRDSALKVVPTTSADFFSNVLEPELQHLVAHPQIVRVESAEVWADPAGVPHILIEMEVMKGGSLQEAIQKDIGLRDSVFALKDALFALHHAHSFGIVHRDVKPGNILFGKNGAKLSDFGIAMAVSRRMRVSNFFYNANLAPESIRAPVFTPQSDVYAAGLALFRAVNGIKNWRAARGALPDSKESFLAGTVVKDMGFQAHVPAKLQRVIRKACHADPTKRYASSAAFRDALERLNFDRDWRRTPQGWECTHSGKREQIVVSQQRTSWSVDYVRGQNRRRQACRAGMTQAVATKYAAHLVADTALT